MDWMLREQGSRDWRLLPVALTLWSASLSAHLAFDEWSAAAQPESAKTAMNSAVSTSATASAHVMTAIVIILAVVALIMATRLRTRWMGTVAVCLAVACIGGITAIAADSAAWRDSASVWARNHGTLTQVRATVIAPMVASDRREYACQADVRLNGISMDVSIPAARSEQVNPAMQRSSAQARVYMPAQHCSIIHRGAVYHLSGTLKESEYGRMPLWLSVEDGSAVAQVEEPPWHRAMIEHMQQSFFHATERLSDQGRILVPGLTMGVLGQDYASVAGSPAYEISSDTLTTSRTNAINETYSNTLEERFQRCGIMHLMAVSGGHFVLLADIVRRTCMRLLLKRSISAMLMACSYVLLALLMFPGDSVTRALIMGLLGIAAYGIGRRAQSVSALSWTVIVVLIVNPDMSRSYGFALSSAAVIGIVLFTKPLSDAFRRLLPEPIAQMTAMTMGAQIFTLPIQILMEPELPLLSIPANLLVSPFVGFATLTGLMALSCAWCAPWLAGLFAWIASLGTLVMEQVAMWLGASDWAVLPWPEGVSGAVLMLAAEGGIAALAVFTVRIVRRRGQDGADADLPGRYFGSTRRLRMMLWWQETRRLLIPDADGR
ncbi:ComA protein [Bifidobacterium sp. DSM 109959]|uniref:ComA protein n=2 Tax=Bifidobacterium olomucense TaxID=2675324 RepID=A0A7Y0EX69_9BIFI|nr:ComA protein [Bifidobacterium sp. DSM 109959]